MATPILGTPVGPGTADLPAAPAGDGSAHRATRPGFGLVGPRRGRHVLAAEQLAELTLPVGDDGVIVGEDLQGQPAVVGFNRPEPYDVVLVGGLWTAQVLAFRAAATGARVAVETGRPHLWSNLVQVAGGGQQCMTVFDVGRVPPQGPSVGSPVLVVRDCGMRPPRGRVAALPWQAVLTLLPYLSPAAPRLVEAAALVGVQRVSPEEARQLGRVLGLPEADVSALPELGDGATLWCTRRSRVYVATRPTDAESGLLGAPRRVD
ncbi:hypothetical protein RKE29_16355 [Streptomyces sp. B1866]|uniref:hypothetical protein n=1 Tax=Streptomyces sp. B1866 TaxID=3075431 RepID=UPI002890E1BB|nr:hypothetical protein [Streptomyces sp. B1866]MDT3398195.1 hypothetical protein [Streptomyces sp. B1866]